MFLAALWDINERPSSRHLDSTREYKGLCILTRNGTDSVGAGLQDIPVILPTAAIHAWASPAINEYSDIERLATQDITEIVTYRVSTEAKGPQSLIAHLDTPQQIPAIIR